MKKSLFAAVAVAALAAGFMAGLGGCGGGGNSPVDPGIPKDTVKYSVVVLDGDSAASGSGKYAAGATVTIKAGTPPAADTTRFKEWTVDSGAVSLVDKKKAVTTFVMPEANVRVRAVFEEIPFYNVVVSSISNTASGSGPYRVGSTVEIFAGLEPNGLEFEGWTPNSVTFTVKPVKGGATFTMPESDIVVRANFVFKDDRDNKKYKITIIGGKTWMAQNLNFVSETGSSKCYGDSVASCNKYGRLYDWTEASSVCPIGWHLPTEQDWDNLVEAVGGATVAGTKLKADKGWYQRVDGIDSFGNGTDSLGFSALPGGRKTTRYELVNTTGYWWTSSDDEEGSAAYRRMKSDNSIVDGELENQDFLFSVRCLKN